MAKLWEDTLIIALRDAQWTLASATASYPPHYWKMDGNAESALGDLTTCTDENHFFLFEVKSTRGEIVSEWVSDGDFKPKKLYRKLQSTIDDFAYSTESHEMAEAKRRAIQSMRCHHFVYWGDPIKGEFDPYNHLLQAFDSIRVEQYLGAVMRMSDQHAPSRHLAMEPHFGMTLGFVDASVAVIADDISYPLLAAQKGFAARLVVGENEITRGPPWELGLPLDQFQDYVNFLTEDDGDEALHAIIHAPTLGLLRIVSRTSELRHLLTSEALLSRAALPRDARTPSGIFFDVGTGWKPGGFRK